MSITSFATLPLSALNDDELFLVDALGAQLAAYGPSNLLKERYYEGEQLVENLNISIPPSLDKLQTVVGWPGTSVDVLEERLDWYGWIGVDGDDVFGLDTVYEANGLAVDSSLNHLDALIYGTSFVVVGAGEDGEPNPLVTVHSPLGMTGMWDLSRRRLSAALAVSRDESTMAVVQASLYRPNETIHLEADGSGWKVAHRDEHNYGRVPVVQFVNRPRASRRGGRSEISKAVRYYTDAAVRTMLGMEVNREFYSAPQRYALGVDAEDFVGADGTVRTGWETIMGRVWAIGRDDNGELPTVGQFTPSSPAPYLEQVKGLSQLLAAEAAIPPSYLGFQTDNPASADAIQRSEARLVKRAERRQQVFGRSWGEVGRLALLVRDGEIPSDFESRVTANYWRDAATPTRSAAADEATKLVSVGVLPQESRVTMSRIGLSPHEQQQLLYDRRRAEGRGVLDTLRQAAERVSGADDA